MFRLALLSLLLQQQTTTSPASGDTTGYWQQHVSYRIVATLDEQAQKLRATGTMTYVNHSPDTLREMYVHQYLNAFRPHSKWSEVDAREARVRFQDLAEPDQGYERFTSAPTVNGTGVLVNYPGSPDSTVAHFMLPRPLAPGDSVVVGFTWDARPSTVPRRQARRGRQWDMAQWYPKVAVYDRGGWEPNAFQPAGELYGEFGDYDVTLITAEDQVMTATGVPVSGDPGWERARRAGTVFLNRNAYGAPPAAPDVTVPAGMKAVRWYARDVHHFAWTTSPQYRYEGGVYVRPVHAHERWTTWDSVGIHVLYQPGDDSTFGGLRAVERSKSALTWLESIWGPYAYPAFSNVHRIDRGGTEFPMLVMNGSASIGLILHEGGHVFTYGIVANNEWKAGWMDEGLTDYQTYWAQRLTPQERAADRATARPALLPRGYRVNALTLSTADSSDLKTLEADLRGRAEPIATLSQDFREFGSYNDVIYDRACLMYGQLRDVLGDTTFRAFFHDYFSHWALRHVDEKAIRASAERASGRDLAWFFDEWLHGTGLMDYAVTSATTTQRPDGAWVTRVGVSRLGELRHPMPVGVRSASGWVIGRADQSRDAQEVEVVTRDIPIEVRLDPDHVTFDWDRRNDTPGSDPLGLLKGKWVTPWPLLRQESRGRSIVTPAPALWYSDAGGAAIGVRVRSHYISTTDRWDLGLAMNTRAPNARINGLQGWIRTDDPSLPWSGRPLMGLHAEANALDGVALVRVSQTWDVSRYTAARTSRTKVSLGATSGIPYAPAYLPEQWDTRRFMEAIARAETRWPRLATSDSGFTRASGSLTGGFAGTGAGEQGQAYLRAEGSVANLWRDADQKTALFLRGYAASSTGPRARAIYASTQDPVESFHEDLWRPAGALFKQPGVNVIPLGGAMMRGYDPSLALRGIGAVNAELSRRLRSFGSTTRGRSSIWVSGFADAGTASAAPGVLNGSLLADAGVGVSIKGKLFDRELHARLDAPLFVHQSALAGWRGLGSSGREVAPRWVLSLGDLW
ncbi:MAG: hypothetical protein JWO05_3552 [Gemmatimonadetes bacterium]|nr:hypothetical protein [Gemmatimonadota bacterium]